MANVTWHTERLNEMSARVQAEAASQAARIIEAMDDFADVPWREQMEHHRQFGTWLPEKRPYSAWELDRVVFPRLLKELDELAAA